MSDKQLEVYHICPNNLPYRGKPYNGDLVSPHEPNEFTDLESAIEYCLQIYDRAPVKFSVYSQVTGRVVFPRAKY